MADKQQRSVDENQLKLVSVTDEMDNKSDDGHDEDQDHVVTLQDVLEEEQEMEDTAFALLGGIDDKSCTYLRGYVSRQPIYACNTCQTKDSEPAGICLGCTYHCHDGHELYELYTKRDFRCDCGNDKFLDTQCKLNPVKEPENEKNKYNQNFSGIYCTCKRPYPDPEALEDETMIQCVVCEDWFHFEHIGGQPDKEEYEETICVFCMEKMPFLWAYYCHEVGCTGEEVEVKATDESKDVDVSHVSHGVSQTSQSSGSDMIDSGVESGSDSVMSVSSPARTCKLALTLKEKGSNSYVPETLRPTYWTQGWRNRLCKCSECMSLYVQANCCFLTDIKDTVHYYEAQAKEQNIQVSQYDKGLSALQNMNRVQRIEVQEGFNEMKSSLSEFLKKFADNNKVVREEDIKEFFEGFKANKRRKIEIPYHCK